MSKVNFHIIAISLGLVLMQAPGLFSQSVPNGQLEIRGMVVDDLTAEPLPLVTIRLVPGEEIYSTGMDGRFSIVAKPETDSLIFSYVGYERVAMDVDTVQSGSIEVQLSQSIGLTETVIVTAQKKAQVARLSAASVDVLTAEGLDQRGVQTFDQAFDELSGVVVTRSTGANVQALSIRGASEVAGGGTGNRVLLLIDGRPAISPESGGALWNLAPLNSVERIEVLKGPYSSLYGSSAMGGAINIITRRAGSEPRTTLNMNYGFFEKPDERYDFQEYRDFKTLELSHSQRQGKWEYVFDGGVKSNQGYKEMSSFNLYNAYGKINYRIDKNRGWQFSGNINHIDNDTPATWFSAGQPYSVAEHRKDDRQARREYNFDLLYYAYPGQKVKYSNRLFYYRNNSIYTFDDNPGNDSTNINIGKQIVQRADIMSDRIGYQAQVDWQPGEKHYVLAGAEVLYDKVNGQPDTFYYGEHDALNLALFLQDEVRFDEKWTATVGLRMDRYRLDNSFDETNLSPKLSVLYKPSNHWNIRFLAAQAFRYPAMAERFIKFEQGGGLRFRPNPELRSERITLSLELGARGQIGPGRWFDIAFFHNRYDGLISFQQISRPLEPLVFEVINLKEAVMQGVELSFNYGFLNRYALRLGYTYLDARDISPGRVNDFLPYKVRHVATGAVTANWEPVFIRLGGRYRSGVEEVFIYPGSEPEAAFIADLSITWNIDPDIQAYFVTNNLTNTEYEELERYRMPGRHYTLGLRFDL